MQTEISTVLQQTRDLAEQRGWGQVAELSTALCDDNGNTVVIAAPAGVDATPLLEWAKSTLSGVEAKMVGLEGLAQNPAPVLSIPQLLAVFECGKIIEADAMEAFSSVFFGRPSSSYAVVLTGAELVDTPEELETAQRAAWRLLVPDPKPEWGGQDLLQQGCFLWSEGEPKEFLQLRAGRDKAALATWLKVPAKNAQTLERDAALYVLDLAETHLSRDSSALALDGQSDLEAHQLDSTLELLSNMRRHLVRRLDADASSLERQLTASLQTLEQNLIQGLPDYLHKQARLDGEADVQQVLREYISKGVSDWETTTHALLSRRGHEISGEVEDMFASVDWELVNRIADRQGKIEIYPQAITDKVMKSGSLRVTLPAQLNAGLVGGNAPQSDIVRKVLGTMMIIGVSTVLLGPAGIVAGTVASVVGMRKAQRIGDERRAEAFGRTAIHDVIGQAISHIRDLARTTIGPTRDAVNKELRVIEEMLDNGLSESRNALFTDGASNPDRDLLDSLRLQVLDAEPSGHDFYARGTE